MHRIAIGTWEGEGHALVVKEVARQLTQAGFIVTENRTQANAILSGVVQDYRASQKTMVYLGTIHVTDSSGQTTSVTSPVVSLPNSAVLTLDSGAKASTQLVATHASVAILARLTDDKSGHVEWVQQSDYEALETTDAISVVVKTLVRQMPHTLTATSGSLKNPS